MAAICQARVNFFALDQPRQPTRIRLRSTMISIQHEGDPARSPHVNIVYFKEGRLYRVPCPSVVLANGNWTINSVVRDLPAAYRHAYAQFFRAPCLMANVAVATGVFLPKWASASASRSAESATTWPCVALPPLAEARPFLARQSHRVTLKILFANPGRPLPNRSIPAVYRAR